MLVLWTVNPNEHTKVRKINSFIKEAYITLLTAAQKQLPLLESSRHIADNLLSKGVLND